MTLQPETTTLEYIPAESTADQCHEDPRAVLNSLAWHLCPNLRDWRETDWFREWLRLAYQGIRQP